ncbi:MAG: hypothetical protein ACC707_17405 [Thiohalomonadales bacterium]
MRTLTHRFLLITIFTSIFLAQISCSSSDDANPNPNPKPSPEQKPIVLEDKPASNGKTQVISDGSESTGRQSAAEILFTTAGDAMAVWRTDTGNGMQLRYSFKLASSNVWPEAKSLLSFSNIDSRFSRIVFPESGFFAANGSQFVLAWNQDDKAYVTHYDPAVSQDWSVPTRLNPNADPRKVTSIEDIKIASNGSSFLATWGQQGALYSNYYDNGSWQASAVDVVDIKKLYPLSKYGFGSKHVLSSSGKNYAIMWMVTGVVNKIRQSIVHALEFSTDTAAPAAWGSVQILSNDTITGEIRDLKLVPTTPGGFLAAWLQSGTPQDFDYRLYSNEFSTVGIQPPASTYLVSGTSGTPLNWGYSLAQNADGYAFAWSERVSTTDYNFVVKVNLYQSGTTPTWTGPLEIIPATAFAFEPTIVNFNNAYAVQWQQQQQILTKTITATDFAQDPVVIVETDNRYQPIFLKPHQSTLLTAWQETDANGLTSIYARETADGINWDAAILLQQHSNDIRFPNNSLYSIRWPLFSVSAFDQDLILSWSASINDNNQKSSKLFTSVYNAGWQGKQTLKNNVVKASGQYPKLVSNAVGHTLAVWYQFDRELYQLFASIRKAGTWSTPVKIDVASNRNAIVFDESVQEFFQIASNGRKFSITWQNVDRVFVQIYDGTSWQSEPTLLREDLEIVYGPVIIPRQELFQVFWIEEDRRAKTAVMMNSITLNNQWKNSPLFTLDRQSTTRYIKSTLLVASNIITEDYALAWLQTNADNAVTISTRVNEKGEWLTPTTIINDLPYKSVNNFSLSSASSGRYALAWGLSSATGRGANVSLFDATQAATWSAPELVLENGKNLALSSNDNTFVLVAGRGNRLLARVYDSDSKLWGSITELTSGDTMTYIDSISMTSNNNEFFVVWNDLLSRQGNIGIAKYSSGTWLSSELSLAPDSGETYIQAPIISAYRDEYALSWGQANLQADASFTQVMGLVGGF